MPQLDTTYFISQLFWLSIFFALFYLGLRSFILPKLKQIITSREEIKKNNLDFASETDLKIDELKNLHIMKAATLEAKIKDLQNEANNKFASLSKQTLENTHKALDKKIMLAENDADLTKKNILTSKELDDLVIDSAIKIIYKISGTDIDKSEIKKLANNVR